MEISIEELKDDFDSDILYGATSFVQALHIPDGMKIPVEDRENVCDRDIPDDIRSLARKLFIPGEMQTSVEEREDDSDSDIPDNVRSLAETLNTPITFARENWASSSGDVGESLQDENTGVISDDESHSESFDTIDSLLLPSTNINEEHSLSFDEF